MRSPRFSTALLLAPALLFVTGVAATPAQARTESAGHVRPAARHHHRAHHRHARQHEEEEVSARRVHNPVPQYHATYQGGH